MKSVIVIALLGCTVVSCKKTYQCQCTEIHNYETWNPIITNVAIEKKTKNDATAICNSLAFDLGNGNYKTTELKN